MVIQPHVITAKLSFQSFTNLIPSAFSWSARSPKKCDTPIPPQDGEALGHLSFISRKVTHGGEERCYVSKEKQLEKLRSRLAEEQRIKYAGGTGQCDD